MHKSKLKGCFLSNRADWRTPKKLIEDLTKEFGILFDPCPANPQIDGLEVPWNTPAFVNPEYGRSIIKWIKKALIEKRNDSPIIFLLPVRTDTVWFQDYVLPFAKEIRFIRGRLRFDDYKGSAPFPSMLVIF